MKDKEFTLFGSTWKIQYVKGLQDEEGKWLWGLTESPSLTIKINTIAPDGTPIPKQELKITLLHEIVHSIFFTGQYLNCNNDEPLVEWTARCLKTLKDQHII